MPLGLIGSEQLDDYWQKNTRRRIFYAYPNGTAPLTGFLSMMDNEVTPQPQFGWNEERWTSIKTQTISSTAPTSTVVFYQAGTNTTAGTPWTPVQFTAVRMYVVDNSNFQTDDTIRLTSLDLTSGTGDINGRVTAVGAVGAGKWIEFEPINVLASTVLNSASANINKYVLSMGSAFAEGARSRTGRQVFPSEIINYTQIFKTSFEMTRTALKENLTYDKTGAYKDVCKTNGITHLSQIEWSAFFGDRSKTTAIDPDTGQTVRRSTMGGLLWFLKQWELGSVGAGGAFDYGQDNVSTQTDYITYTNKRIIKLAGATINRTTFNSLNTRIFERTNASTFEKLCFCGPDYLAKVSDMFERQIQFTNLRENGFKGFDFELVQHNSNAGKVYYKQHPLFLEPWMRSSAFYIDLGYIGYRPLADSDTDIQPMIQLPDADKRKDQWLTECGLEFRFPEAFMFVDNLGGITN